jgi:hypothetical protein
MTIFLDQNMVILEYNATYFVRQGQMFQNNKGTYLPNYMVSHPRRPLSEHQYYKNFKSHSFLK